MVGAKSTAWYSAGELLTASLFLRDGSAVVSACACPCASLASTESPKSGISRYSWPPTTFSCIACTAAAGVQKLLRCFPGRQQTEARGGQSNLAYQAIVALKLSF